MTGVAEHIRPDSRIRLHELAYRADRAEWIVGRFDSRRFVALPAEGKAALDLLSAGHTIEHTAALLLESDGIEFDILSFARVLLDVGFIAEVDGRAVAQDPPMPASLPLVRPRHVRFALHPVIPLLVGLFGAAAAAVLVLRPDLRPTFHHLLWSRTGSAVLAFGFVVGWVLVLVHELAHFAVARATGVYARIQLGTRLQFLVAETDISGIELAPRRHRMTAYLAGVATNVSVASLAILCGAVVGEDTVAYRTLGAIVVIALLPVPFQFMVFMRTDIYFVLQDLAGCRDLHGDGRKYARYTCERLRRKIFRSPSDSGRSGVAASLADPSRSLPTGERNTVRLYSVILVVGTVACLTVLATVTLPADITLFVRAMTRLGPAESMVTNIDSAVVLAILITVHSVWAVTWYRRHRWE